MQETFESDELTLPSLLTHVKVIVRPVNGTKQNNLLAVAELQFLDSDGIVVSKVRGFRIVDKVFPNGERLIDADYPSYFTKGRYFKSFLAEKDGDDFFHFFKRIIVETYTEFQYQL